MASLPPPRLNGALPTLTVGGRHVPIFVCRVPLGATQHIQVVEDRRGRRRHRQVWNQRAEARAKLLRKQWRRNYPWTLRHPVFSKLLFAALLLMVPVLYMLAP